MDRVPPTERLDRAGGGAEMVLGGRYELRSVLGRGGMSEVYAAWDTTLQREVAVKRLHANAATNEGRQRSEARLLASLNHPNLVWVYDAQLEGPHPFFVMELVPGPNLAQWLHDHGTLSTAVVTRFGVQLAGALAHIHERGLVHRDVKPANILLASDRDAKLADFGIARFTGATRVTATGAVLGTAAYLSPEQVQGGSVGPGSDVYSLGLVLLECLTGQVAYPGAVVESAIARLHRRPDVPSGFGALGELLEAMTDPILSTARLPRQSRKRWVSSPPTQRPDRVVGRPWAQRPSLPTRLPCRAQRRVRAPRGFSRPTPQSNPKHAQPARPPPNPSTRVDSGVCRRVAWWRSWRPRSWSWWRWSPSAP